MKISLESTDQVVSLNGVLARVWQGKTESGVNVQAFITRIAVDQSDAAACEIIARELRENAPPTVEWPLFMIMDGDEPPRCRVCGCTEDDCSQCVERTGEPCSWVAVDLCSACAGGPAVIDSATCRRCTECVGEQHHWLTAMPECPEGGEPFIPCKHCDARAALCDECFEGPIWPIVSPAICKSCRFVAEAVEGVQS
jgi:hypothetical protein